MKMLSNKEVTMSLFQQVKDEDKLKLEGLSVKKKLMVFILPVVIASLVLLTIVTTIVSKNVILSRSDSQMQATLGEYTNQIAGKLDGIKAETNALAYSVGGTYKSANVAEYKYSLSKLVSSNDMVLGSGLWFEPNVFDENEKYYGPYWYKNVVDGKWDGADLIETWDYSNADYDYFSQEYYVNSKTATSAVITEPYYDSSSGLVMASCSAPIKNEEGKFIGCVTVDVMLTSIDKVLSEVKVGDTGTVWLIDGNYNYIYQK